MKNALNLFLFALSTLMLSSCFHEPEYITADPIEFSSEGGTKIFENVYYTDSSIHDDKGNKSVDNYYHFNDSRIDTSTLDWLNLELYSPSIGPNTLTVTAEKNDTGKGRTLYIRADIDGATYRIYTIPVIQSK